MTDPLQFLFLGTGASSGLPLTPCLTLSHSYPEAFTSHVPPPTAPPSGQSAPPGHYDPRGPWPRNVQCACCRSSVDPDVPEGWKNKRGNTSAIVRRRDGNGKWRNVLVDCGKTFVEQARRFFPRWDVQTIDAVLLTHGHADAYFGLDDLREWCVIQRGAIPIYLNRPTYEAVAKSFPYLVDHTQASGGGDVPSLDWNIIEDLDEFDVCGIRIKSYPVHHGVYFTNPPRLTSVSSQSAPSQLPPKSPMAEPLICLAFKFDDDVLYMADVSDIPEVTWRKLLGEPTNGVLGSLSKISVMSKSKSTTPPSLPILIIDSLWPFRSHSSHYSFGEALTAALQFQPAMTYLLGSTHPATHFIWEELCFSLHGEHGKRPNHPDDEIAKEMVKKLKKTEPFVGPDGVLARWQAWGGGKVAPAWDGLVLEIDGKGKWGEIEAPQRMGGWM